MCGVLVVYAAFFLMIRADYGPDFGPKLYSFLIGLI